ncbi:Cyclin fold protein [Spironucleus salmonicida]|uniref:Cyclin fold protein n=1 Tax=Spironucleus salmonicida TaxID=348837 RepID=V6LKM4_9EUKA|nr:Cyclin fold protein [Spironucleus salmonicida]|eukprot:EST45127.1 Cyclin fold protein [Spironucleus salmonicida]
MQRLNQTVKGITCVLYSKLVQSQLRGSQKQVTKLLDVFEGQSCSVSFNDIYLFIYKLFRKAQIEPECLIAALIYIDQFQAHTQVNLSQTNFYKIVFTAIVLASKTWDDVSCSTKSFSLCTSLFSQNQLVRMERVFIGILDYKLFLESQDYKDYYYNLKKIWQSLQVQEDKEISIIGWNEWYGEVHTTVYLLDDWGIEELISYVCNDVKQIQQMS